MRTKIRQQLANRKRRIERRLDLTPEPLLELAGEPAGTKVVTYLFDWIATVIHLLLHPGPGAPLPAG